MTCKRFIAPFIGVMILFCLIAYMDEDKKFSKHSKISAFLFILGYFAVFFAVIYIIVSILERSGC